MHLNNDPKIKNMKMDNLHTELIIELLYFLHLLTENHNSNLQNYLREQVNNKVSFNFIQIITNYMEELLSKMNTLILDEGYLTKETTLLYYKRFISCLETLCEFLQVLLCFT